MDAMVDFDKFKTKTHIAPDIFTASHIYANRFTGKTGKFLLKRQEEVVLSLLPADLENAKILEVGAGHVQLTPGLLRKGHSVWVHASSELALQEAKKLQEKYPDNCQTFVSPLDELPFADQSFDIVIAIRLLCHIENWQGFVKELCRVSKKQIILDFPPKQSFNIFYPLAYFIKNKIENNTTRPFMIFSQAEVERSFEACSFNHVRIRREYFFPMALHRLLKNCYISNVLEKISELLGLTRFFGAPVVISSERKI